MYLNKKLNESFCTSHYQSSPFHFTSSSFCLIRFFDLFYHFLSYIPSSDTILSEKICSFLHLFWSLYCSFTFCVLVSISIVNIFCLVPTIPSFHTFLLLLPPFSFWFLFIIYHRLFLIIFTWIILILFFEFFSCFYLSLLS